MGSKITRYFFLCIAILSFLGFKWQVSSDDNEAYVIDKKVFDDEWYSRAVLVDKQYLNSEFFIGRECDLERIKFKITENYLIAYRSYAKVEGFTSVDGKRHYEVAKFPIKKHFDLKLQYDPHSGLKTNVIEENDTDNYWHDRKYVRVDWSQNQVPDASCNAWFSYAASFMINGSDFDGNDSWRFKYATADNKKQVGIISGEVNYLETTLQAVVNPVREACANMGETSCQSTTARMKFSFRKIDQKKNYEKRDYQDYKPILYGNIKNTNKMCMEWEKKCVNLRELWTYTDENHKQAICDINKHPDVSDCKQQTTPIFARFGYFRTDRHKYDRKQGFLFSGKKQYINRWNIWQESLTKEEKPIPLKERIPKTIVYYLNAEFPDDLVSIANDIANDWNSAFVHMLAELKNQCSKEKVKTYVADNKLENLFYLDNMESWTEKRLKKVCDRIGKHSQKANLTFFSGSEKQISEKYGKIFQIKTNTCNVKNVNSFVENYNLKNLLSKHNISNVNSDNLLRTCSILEWNSSKIVDIPTFHWQQVGDLRYSFLNYTKKAELASPLGYGPSAADPLTGEIISGDANVYGKSIDMYASFAADIVAAVNGDLKDIDIKNGEQSYSTIALGSRSDNVFTASADFDRFVGTLKNRMLKSHLHHEHNDDFDSFKNKIRTNSDLVSIPTAAIGENWLKLQKTTFEEDYLLTDEMIMAFANESGGNISHDKFAKAKPSYWAFPSLPQSKTMHRGLPKNTVSSEGFHNISQKRAQFLGKHSACFTKEVVEPAVYDLATSLKGMSKEEVYKVVRAGLFKATAAHEVGHTLGLRHNFASSKDALNFPPEFWGVTLASNLRKKPKFRSQMQYSSIMDYHQRFNSDFSGIGLYDRAAILFGYGGLVEIFDESNGKFLPILKSPLFGTINWHDKSHLFSYKDLPFLYSKNSAFAIAIHISKIQGITDPKRAIVNIRKIGLHPKPENLYKRKTIPFEKYYREVTKQSLSEVDTDIKAKGEKYLYHVPYKYCSDRYARDGDLGCQLYDMGVSAKESVDNAIELYEAYHIFDSYRRDRANFSLPAYWGRVNKRFKPLLMPFRYMYAYHNTSLKMFPMVQDWMKAGYTGFNYLLRVLQKVEPGEYCKNQKGIYVLKSQITSCEHSIFIDDTVGKYYDSAWSSGQNYNLQRVGYMYDKLAALSVLTDNTAFLNRDLNSEVSRGAFSVGYYRLFAPELTKLFTGIVLGDAAYYSPMIDEEKGRIIYRSIFGLTKKGKKAYPLIKASTSFGMRYYGLAFSLVGYTSTVDRQLDFAKQARISLVGSSSDPIYNDDILQIIFKDPIYQRKYRAVAPLGIDRSLGYQLLLDSVTFTHDGSGDMAMGEWYKAKQARDKAFTDLENLQELAASSDDEITKLKEIAKESEEDYQEKNRDLKVRIGMIDVVRELGNVF